MIAFPIPPVGLVLLLLAGAGCQSSTPPAKSVPADTTPTPAPATDTVSGTGTIVHSDIEGGFYAIRAEDGTLYDPKSLPEGFSEDGLRVRFVVRIDRNAAGFHQVGPIVDVIEIDRVR